MIEAGRVGIHGEHARSFLEFDSLGRLGIVRHARREGNDRLWRKEVALRVLLRIQIDDLVTISLLVEFDDARKNIDGLLIGPFVVIDLGGDLKRGKG